MLVQARSIARRLSEGTWVAALYAVVLVVLFAPYTLGRASLLSGSHDSASQFISGASISQSSPPYWKVSDPNGSDLLAEPDAKLEQRQLFAEHQLPFWDPYSAMGTPEAAAMQPQSFSPFQIPMLLQPGRVAAWLTVLLRLFVAGFFAYRFFRLFVPAVGAFAGGIAFMLSGYFILFSTQPYLSVDVLLPAYLYALELMLRKPRLTSIAWPALISTFAYFGGMPEAALLLHAYAAVWVIARVIFDSNLRANWISPLGRYAVSGVLGLLGASILLVPFASYLLHSFDTHQLKNVGIVVGAVSYFQRDPHLLALFMMPLLFGPPTQNAMMGVMPGHTGSFNYASVTAIFFVFLALVSSPRLQRGQRFPFVFLAAMLLIVELKMFGDSRVNWIGSLPFFSLVNFAKYANPILSFSFAGLVAYGVASLDIRRLQLWEVATAAVLSFGLLTSSILITVGEAAKLAPFASAFYWASVSGALTALVICVALVSVIAIARRIPMSLTAVSGNRLVYALVFLLALEQSGNYFVPMYWSLDRGPSPAADPYEPSAYVRFLQANTHSNQRIFAAPGLLEPHWAGVFALQDVRDADALTYRSYLPFVRAFLPSNYREATSLEFIGRIGDGLATPLFQKFLTLTSVGLVAGMPTSPDWSQRQLDAKQFVRLTHTAVDIDRYLHPLPRASVYRSVYAVADESTALAVLTNVDFDPFRTVVLNGTEASDPRIADGVTALRSALPQSVTSATIVSYRANEVQIDSGTGNSPRIVMLNDTNIPGWSAYVDGISSPVLNVDYLFRGVYIQSGRHRIDFRYEPRGLALAIAISSVTVLVLALVLVFDQYRKGRRTILRPRATFRE